MNLSSAAAAECQLLRKPTTNEDLVWNAAVEWMMREHEILTPDELIELIAWLKADPAHIAAYDEASYLWKLTGAAMQKTDY
jgi:transmembrane sensor